MTTAGVRSSSWLAYEVLADVGWNKLVGFLIHSYKACFFPPILEQVPIKFQEHVRDTTCVFVVIFYNFLVIQSQLYLMLSDVLFNSGGSVKLVLLLLVLVLLC